MSFYVDKGEFVEISIKATPNAKKTEIGAVENGALKLRLAAQPIEGKANEALVAFFCKTFKMAKRDIEIVGGELGRNKRIRVAKNEKLIEFLKALESE